ncbi:ABC transporter substrate-binding protein [Lachnotalea glycerini]|uniref:Sugar ABC transporter substrate-binding protein n=1 Tax=Lachnotalea glycerini TaxID=1763509 RepID=A0A371JCS2_9FIRM|nr:sugar ABC transporter substrate-binding protein [Lachnotalea glycerini]RDY30477.1 sugar ABC transporter substrate-binding protein [Lachnotalea glycerini]
MNLKKVTALFMASLMSFSLAGCGGSKEALSEDDQKTQTNEATVQEAETENTNTSTAEGEPVTIKITWWGGQSRHDYTQKLLNKYTELNPNVTFEALPSGWDGYFDKLSTQAASGAMPDIVQMDYLYISTFAKNNSIADMQEFVDNGTIDLANVDSNLADSGKIDGKLAGLVLSSSLLTVGINNSVFAEAGIDKPTSDWTWSDFLKICKEINNKTGKYGFSAIMADDTNNFNYYVRQHGQTLFSEDNKSLGYFDDAIYVDFVNMIKELIDAKATPNPDEYDAIKALGYEAMPVATGDGAMVTDWSNYACRLEEVNKNISLVTPPKGESEAANGLWLKPGMFFSVSETSKVKEEAAKFINWFINSEEANEIILAERGTPVSSEIRDYLTNSGKLSDKQKEMFEYVNNAGALCGEAPAPDPVGISEINESFNKTVYSVLYGQASVEDAAKTFRESANEILARNN